MANKLTLMESPFSVMAPSLPLVLPPSTQADGFRRMAYQTPEISPVPSLCRDLCGLWPGLPLGIGS